MTIQQEHKEYLLRKIDYYLTKYIFPRFNPKDVVWVLSLSGGKDSSTMFYLMREWYKKQGIDFICYPFFVKQWDNAVSSMLAPFVEAQGLSLTVIDGIQETKNYLNYQTGNQAPCALCSNVRKKITDEFVSTIKQKHTGKPIVVLRGHHLTDLAISVLWRYLIGINPVNDMLEKGKGKIFVQIDKDYYLGKPLIYFLEDEISHFAELEKIPVSCCGCAACHNPGRRDIIKETVVNIMKKYHEHWEVKFPYVRKLLPKLGIEINDSLFDSRYTLNTHESAFIHLPEILLQKVVQFWEIRLDKTQLPMLFDISETAAMLEDVALQKMRNFDTSVIHSSKIPLPKLFRHFCGEIALPITHEELVMLIALGPFWGKFILDENGIAKLNMLQKKLFPSVCFDSQLSYVNEMVNWVNEGGRQEVPEFCKKIHFSAIIQ